MENDNKKFICIHGHFYQPPRENAWLDIVEYQQSARPYNNWNQKISAECYAPNAFARVVNNKGYIENVVNNYSNMSFNFGATLLSWLKQNEPIIYQSILQADKTSMEKFSGHGSAIAQVYNHMMMPLATDEDKYAQVIWGIKDFEYHFKRFPEGMWLAETGVDLKTLEVLTECGIRFVILSPYQAGKVRALKSDKWKNVSGGNVDTKRAYLCNLPNGKTINIFFYDGLISQGVAFGSMLRSGKNFSDVLLKAFNHHSNETQLVSIATDGETFGHHHKFAEMALAYGMKHIEDDKQATFTIYGEFLKKNSPLYEVEILENTSWSCVHGIKRWKENCGCNSGGRHGWNQKWRGPLRDALDWLRDETSKTYQSMGKEYFKDIYHARNNYINVILDRNGKNIFDFLQEFGTDLALEKRSIAIKLLEAQRFAMLMYTSCGWFFDELSGIETTQIMQYALRLIEINREIGGGDLEAEFVEKLSHAKSNLKKFGDGAKIFNELVKPRRVDALDIACYFGFSNFLTKEHSLNIYSYSIEDVQNETFESDGVKLDVGHAKFISANTLNKHHIMFACLNKDKSEILCGASIYNEEKFHEIKEKLKQDFMSADVKGCRDCLNQNFKRVKTSLSEIVKDKQHEILQSILKDSLKHTRKHFSHLFEENYQAMLAIKNTEMVLPKPLRNIAEFVLTEDLKAEIYSEKIHEDTIKNLQEKIDSLAIDLDRKELTFAVEEKMEQLSRRFVETPNTETAEDMLRLLSGANNLGLSLNLYKTQNNIFHSFKNSPTETLQISSNYLELAEKLKIAI